MGLWSRIFSSPCERCIELEARLFAEIDSNRNREDELKSVALQAAGINGRVSARTSLALPTPRQEQIANTLEVEEPDELLERQIQEVADQMIANGRNLGNEYTEEAQIMLLDAIRKNPNEYLS